MTSQEQRWRKRRKKEQLSFLEETKFFILNYKIVLYVWGQFEINVIIHQRRSEDDRNKLRL